jgi:HK97 gp10 family phage protein
MADFTITGLPSLDRKLKALEPRVAKKVVRQALRKGAKRVQARVKQLAPKGPTGQTRKAVKVRAFKRSRKGTIGVKVQIGKGDYQGTEFYASFAEFGSKRSGTGHKGQRRAIGQRAQHFMERAYDLEKEPVKRDIIAEIRAGIEREART